ncbi:uncharacterized protein LOC119329091 isoform X2 [Triticum dicoccoides]|uniref:uncharacterized protein LOC119329091 isoform X2 n=1 Tax=Triticum dicoccoides TaxID=85692 RepID=UPI000E7BD8E0|nr:uncharacterized protein LOC119329091 isoform X2 [Triticum dicoccoides]
MSAYRFHPGNLVLGTLIYNDTPKQAKKPKEVKCFYLLLAYDEQLQVSTIGVFFLQVVHPWYWLEAGLLSDTINRHSPKVDLEGNSLNKKRKHVSSSPSKKPTKGKANKKGKISNDDMAASIKKLADSLASPIVSVQPMPPTDPYANLWKRINALTIPAKDKLEIVAYLSKPDQDIFRSYLNYADETILGQWVLSFFEPRFQEDGGNGGSATAH